jgi:hypothetical protein
MRVEIRARRYTVSQRHWPRRRWWSLGRHLDRRRPTVGAIPVVTEQVWTTTLAALGGRLPPTGARIEAPDGLLVEIAQLTYVMAAADGDEAYWEIIAR